MFRPLLQEELRGSDLTDADSNKVSDGASVRGDSRNLVPLSLC